MAYLVGSGNQPLLVLKEGTERTQKKDAFSNNVAAALAIAEAVRSTLGPKGLDKLLVDSLGDLTITNDGATILKEIDVQHPTAKMMVEVAKTQDGEIGDGTTTSVILGGNILQNVSELIQGGVHPSIVASGVAKARAKAMEIIDKVAYKVGPSEKDLLKKVISTSMNSKVIAFGKDKLADLVLEAMLTLQAAGVKNLNKNINKVKVIKKEGGDAVHDTKLIKGIVLDKEICHTQMPREVKNAKIALLGYALEVKKGEWDAKISIERPDQVMSFLDEEDNMIKKKVQKVLDLGANVVLSSKAIDDTAVHFLKQAGVMAIKSITSSDMNLIADATGGTIINSLEDISSKDLGTCDLIHEQAIANSKYVFIEGCKSPKALTLLIRGSGSKSLDETERGLHDALCVAATIINDPAIVAGGGAIEIEIAKQLNEYAKTFSGREQLVIQQFAKAMEAIPTTLVENAGIDAIEIVGQIRAAHNDKPGSAFIGYNIFTNKVEDMKAAGVLEPAALIKTAMKTAAEVATMIIRIDDIIKGSKLGGGGGGGGGRGAPPMPED
ncbi:MAG: thermosome subunit [Candidatus Lokiarchaeota archaeon]|nr:thermosome subunit [Candidatus Lokiarchaeota archaeon]